MDCDTGNMSHIIAVLLLFIVSGIAFACEKSIALANKNQLKLFSEEGKKSASLALKKIEEDDKIISGIQTFTTISLVVATIFTVNDFFYCMSNLWIEHLNLPLSKTVAVIILTIIISAIFLVFVKIIPSQIAKKNPTKILMSLIIFVNMVCNITAPLTYILNLFSKGFMVIFRLNRIKKSEEFSEEDVIELLEVGQETGQIKETGMEMISSIFEFDDKFAYEVMTPRTDCYLIDIDDPLESYIDEMLESRYSRIPVYEGDSDNIIGVLNIKDFLIKAKACGFENVSIKDIIRKPYFVPETKKIDDLFKEMQENKSNVAFLIDEYGGFSGLVTMKDIVQEVMGQLDDEYHAENINITRISNNCYLIDGMYDLDDLNEELSIDLKSDEHETIGGFVLENLDDLPEEEKIKEYKIIKGNIELSIESIKDRRIETVKLTINDKDTFKSPNKNN